MKLIPKSAVIRRKASIQAKLADAVAALRLADAKLGGAIDEFDDDQAFAAFRAADDKVRNNRNLSAAQMAFYYEKCSLQRTELLEARYGVRLFAEMLDMGHAPSLATRVFRAIASHANEHPENTPHVEGVVIALKLAERSLASALELAEQLNGVDIDEAYEQPFAARGVVRGYITALVSGSFVFDDEKALDKLVGMTWGVSNHGQGR